MIGVIADDLTGAAEIGAVGWRYGLSAEIVIAGSIQNEADLVCIDTDSRSCTPEDSSRKAAMAAKELQTCGVEWIYKKVDSVLRGPVAAELQGLMKRLGAGRALLVPANPSLGRVVTDGQYFVHGKPIHETDFRRDPEHPRHSCSVLELLGVSGSVPVHICGPDEDLPLKGIIVGEAQTAQDLRQWASRRGQFGVVAGGAEFFDALLQAELAPVLAGEVTTNQEKLEQSRVGVGPELFVCGSLSQSTQEFLAGLRKRGVPAFSLPAGLASAEEFGAVSCEALADRISEALVSNARVALEVGLPRVRDGNTARQLAGYLARLTEAVLSRSQVGNVYVEGGATAACLVRQLGWRRLRVFRENAPGVVTLETVEARPRRLTIKPGSYVWPEDINKE